MDFKPHNLEDYIANDWKILIDTCSLMHDGASKFWVEAIPILQNFKRKIVIPSCCWDELKRLSRNPTKEKQQREKAARCLEDTHHLLKQGWVEIIGDERDNNQHADNALLGAINYLSTKYNVLLITQDNDLASDVLQLRDQKSTRRKRINVKKVDWNGHLRGVVRTNPNANPQSPVPNTYNNRNKFQKQKQVKAPVPSKEVFKVGTSVTTTGYTPLPVRKIPVENDTVYLSSSGATLYLGKPIGSGGEGTIYATNSLYVAKIYKKEKITQRKFEKIRLMQSRPIRCEGICYPEEILYNAYGEFVGYLMPKASGNELQKSLFIKPRFEKIFPNWKKKDTVQLCLTILQKIKYLHDRNIIMGDINPGNILIVDPKTVYFVDVDSYQVENYPCPVGTVAYTAPEIQRKSFPSFLRSKGNENFAIATLLFMIMLPGKLPYAQQGGESIEENIEKMDFSYPLEKNSNKKAPEGPWPYIWSHLTFKLKKAFYHTFAKDGKYASESERLSVDRWIQIFEEYLSLLNSGTLAQNDSMSEELFPTRHKKSAMVNYITCPICNQEVAEDYSWDGYCKKCLKQKEVYPCAICGTDIEYSNHQKYVKHLKRRSICKTCHEAKKNNIHQTINQGGAQPTTPCQTGAGTHSTGSSSNWQQSTNYNGSQQQQFLLQQQFLQQQQQKQLLQQQQRRQQLQQQQQTNSQPQNDSWSIWGFIKSMFE